MVRLLQWLEIGVGGVFLYSGLHHATNPYQFASAAAAYELVPLAGLRIAPFVLSSLMIVLGVGLISRLCLQFGRWLSVGIFIMFAAAQATSWLYGMEISCGCFGHSADPISLKSVSVPVICAGICLGHLLMQPLQSNGSASDNATSGAPGSDSINGGMQ